jgi:hypothetical protein
VLDDDASTGLKHSECSGTLPGVGSCGAVLPICRRLHQPGNHGAPATKSSIGDDRPSMSGA